MGALRELTWGWRKTVDEAVAGTEEVYGLYSRHRSRLA
jgi:hypothetical protein